MHLCIDCGTPLSCNTKSRHKKGLCKLLRCKNCRFKGILNPRYKNARTKNSSGYIVVSVDGKLQYEHRLIIEKELGRKLKNDEIVHHINKIKHDNRVENLEITTQSKHTTKHERGLRGYFI